jgi:hypothetical protein
MPLASGSQRDTAREECVEGATIIDAAVPSSEAGSDGISDLI